MKTTLPFLYSACDRVSSCMYACLWNGFIKRHKNYFLYFFLRKGPCCQRQTWIDFNLLFHSYGYCSEKNALFSSNKRTEFIHEIREFWQRLPEKKEYGKNWATFEKSVSVMKILHLKWASVVSYLILCNRINFHIDA